MTRKKKKVEAMTTNKEEVSTNNEELSVEERDENMGPENNIADKCISCADFESLGLLQEINRMYLNPVGLSLEPSDGGEKHLFTVVDSKLSTVDSPTMHNVRKFQAIQVERNGIRKKKLGFVTQPLK